MYSKLGDVLRKWCYLTKFTWMDIYLQAPVLGN